MCRYHSTVKRVNRSRKGEIITDFIHFFSLQYLQGRRWWRWGVWSNSSHYLWVFRLIMCFVPKVFDVLFLCFLIFLRCYKRSCSGYGDIIYQKSWYHLMQIVALSCICILIVLVFLRINDFFSLIRKPTGKPNKSTSVSPNWTKNGRFLLGSIRFSYFFKNI